HLTGSGCSIPRSWRTPGSNPAAGRCSKTRNGSSGLWWSPRSPRARPTNPMDGRFTGRVTNSLLSYITVAPPARISGPPRLTVFADGFISNLADLESGASRRGERPADSLAGWVGLAYHWWGNQLSRWVLGQLAAAVVNHHDRSVTLIQDSLGIAQLFY